MSRASRFEGTIGRTIADSEAWFDDPPHPGGEAPNVVMVLLDDTGFAQFGCYGSDIDTPNVDALAAGGLQFTNFHVTPLVLADPGLAAHGTLAARGRHACGVELPYRVPESARTHQQPRGNGRRGVAERGVLHLLRRQMAPRAHGAVLGGRSVRPVAARSRLRPVLRLPRR